MINKKGKFISFEGPEAVLKSSQINKLKKFLSEKKIPFYITREPGGTKIAEKLRSIILNKKYNISNNEELLLLMAARLNNINNIIKPNIEKGRLVISDRYCHSTFVYQCYVNKFGIEKGIKLHKELLDNFLPDKTFLFLLTPKTILKRLNLNEKVFLEKNYENKYHY